jgi:small subunit ribosomal protein S17
MKKTAVVTVTRRVLHPKYKKYYEQSKKYHAHDPEERTKVGEVVTIEEMRPMSKTKRWRVVVAKNV